MSAPCAFVLGLLAFGAGCGEDVLIGNWQLRSLSDAGIVLPSEADAGANQQAAEAADARNHLRMDNDQSRDNDQNDHDESRSGNDKNH